MKTTTGIKSVIRPVEIDDFNSKDCIYVRSNIEEITEMDPVFNTQTTMFKYDETEYSLVEWTKLCNESLRKEIEKTNLALIETLEILELIFVEMDTDAAECTYISVLYGNMINKGLISIDMVPDRYREKVNLYLSK